MILRNRLLLAVAVGGLFLAGPGCTKPTNPPQKFAFVAAGPDEVVPLYQAAANKFHDETGVQVDFKVVHSLDDQNAAMDDLYTQPGYTGMAVSLIAPMEQATNVSKTAGHFNIVCVGDDSPLSKRVAHIGTDWYKAGQSMGQQIVTLLPDGGNIVILARGTGSLESDARLKGIRDAASGHKIDVVVKKEAAPDAAGADAQKMVADATANLKLICDLDGTFGGTAADVINTSGNKGKVFEVCFGGSDAILKGIENGTISCTMVDKPFENGYQALKLMSDLLKKGPEVLPAGRSTDTGVDLVNAANVKDYRASQDKLLKK